MMVIETLDEFIEKIEDDGALLKTHTLPVEAGSLRAEDKKALEGAIAKAKEDLKAENVDDLRKAIDDLSKASNDVVSKLYSQAKPEGAEGAAADGEEIVVENPEVSDGDKK